MAIAAKKFQKDMTKGNIPSLMISFALPILLSQFFQQLYNSADAFIVGKFLGTNAFAAVTSSGNLIFLMTSFFVGTSLGAGVVISKYFGAGDYDSMDKAIHTHVAIGLIGGVLLTIIGVTLTPVLLKLMKTDEAVMSEATEYFRFYFFGGIPLVMYNVCQSIMNALGDSKRPLYYLIFSSLTNVALDVLFVAVFKWGVWSAAFATVVSQLLSVVLCFVWLSKKTNLVPIVFKKIKLHPSLASEIIKYGIPSGVQNSVIGLANTIVQSYINSFGAFATAGYGAHCKVEGFAFLPINSFTMAISTFIGQNLGAGKTERAKKGARFGLIVCVALAETIGVIYYVFADSFIGFFEDAPEVIYYGSMQAKTVALFYGVLAFSHGVAAVCRGAGKATVSMFVMLSVWCVFRIIYITIIMKIDNDISHIYPAYPLTWIISSVILFIYYKFSGWQNGFSKAKSE